MLIDVLSRYEYQPSFDSKTVAAFSKIIRFRIRAWKDLTSQLEIISVLCGVLLTIQPLG
jgi:hypothetical protein